MKKSVQQCAFLFRKLCFDAMEAFVHLACAVFVLKYRDKVIIFDSLGGNVK